MIGWMQVRIGPNRVGPAGLLQPIADALEVAAEGNHRPGQGEQVLVPDCAGDDDRAGAGSVGRDSVRPEMALANINAGLLFVMAITSMGVYGVIVAGWASNSKYAFLGAMRRRRRCCPMKSPWVLRW